MRKFAHDRSIVLFALVFCLGSLYANQSVSGGECTPHWLPGESGPGFFGPPPVFALATTQWDPDGPGPQPTMLVVGGSFTHQGAFSGLTVNRIAAWNGQSWQSFGSGFNGNVSALIVHNGDLIAAGGFTMSGGTAVNRVARWDGAAWQPLGPGVFGGTSPGVSSMTIYQGDLVVCGRFTTAGATPANHIARWNGADWTALGTGTSSNASAVVVFNNELIVGGSFLSAGGITVNGLARWNGAWQAFPNGGTNPTGGVFDFLIDGDGLIASGGFTTIGGVPANYIARWNGTTWIPYGTGLGLGGGAMVFYNGDLIVGGGFTSNGSGDPINRIARWTGASWVALGTGLENCTGTGCSPIASSLEVFNGNLIVVGGFLNAGGVLCNYIAQWNGTTWRALGNGLSGPVSSLHVYGGDLIATGAIVTASGNTVSRIIRWDGTQWHSLGAGLGPVRGISMTTFNGDLIVGGDFLTAGGGAAWNIARWNGTNWSPIGTGLQGMVHAVTVADVDGPGGNPPMLYAGGDFQTTGSSVVVNRIARWDGANWQPLGTGVSARVAALTEYNGELYAAGAFVTASGVTVNRVARWNGSVWQGVGGGVSSTAGSANCLAMMKWGDQLILSGDFQFAGGVLVNRVSRWDGTQWHALGSGFTQPGVNCLTVYNGELVAAGANQPAINSTAARWNGASWNALAPNPPDVAVNSLAVFQDELVAGGAMLTAGGGPSAYWARWDGCVDPAATGACCLSGGDCLVQSPAYCLTVGGTFQGNGSACSPDPCTPRTGACCLPTGYCQIKTSAECAAVIGASYRGDDTTCPATPPCGNEGNMNGDGQADALDIQCMVECLAGSPTPPCSCVGADLDGNGVVNASDVPPFVCILLGLPPNCTP